MILRILLAIPTWFLFLILWVPLAVLGFILIPIALILEDYHLRPSYYFKHPDGGVKLISAWKDSIMFLWGNEEDGIVAGKEFLTSPLWWRIFYWSAIRNPVNNLRFIKYLSVIPDSEKVKFIGSFGNNAIEYDNPNIPPRPEWFFAYQGWYSNFFIHFRMFGNLWRFWIGWKIYPSDVISPLMYSNYRKYGAGFAIQFKRLT